MDQGNGSADGARFVTFVGQKARKFGTVVFTPSFGRGPTPPVASNRRYLRSALPAVYQDSDFTMRFVGGFETVLDPIVALLDALPAQFDPDLASRDVLELLTRWLGVELEEARSRGEQREVVRGAAELGRRRGTRRGLELALGLSFPGVPFRVEDGGGVEWATDAGTLPKAAAPSFVVYCDAALPEERLAAVARLIERVKPVDARYRLRVKAARKRKTKDTAGGDPG